MALYRAATLTGDEDARLRAATNVVCRPPLTPELVAALESTDWIEVAWLAGRAASSQWKNRRFASARDLYALATSMAARLHGRETVECGILARELASSSVELNDLETATEAAHEAILTFRVTSDPRVTGAQIVLADALARGGAFDEAAAELRAAIAAAQGPERAELRVQAGVRLALLLAQRDDAAALEAGEAVWRDARGALSPSDIAYVRAVATCAHRRRRSCPPRRSRAAAPATAQTAPAPPLTCAPGDALGLVRPRAPTGTASRGFSPAIVVEHHLIGGADRRRTGGAHTPADPRCACVCAPDYPG